MTEWIILFSNMLAGGLRILVCLFFISMSSAQEESVGKNRIQSGHAGKDSGQPVPVGKGGIQSGHAGEDGGSRVPASVTGGRTPRETDILRHGAGRLQTVWKQNGRRVGAGVLGVAGAFVIIVFRHLTKLPDFCQMALEAVWITVCAGRLQEMPRREDVRMNLFMGIFYEITVSFWQFLTAAGLGILFHSRDFLDSAAVRGQAAVWAVHLILVVLVISLSGKHGTAGEKAYRFVSGAASAGIIAVVTLSQQEILEIPEDTLSMWTILSVVLLMSVLVFKLNRRYEMEKELVRLRSEQAELLERDYTTLNQAYAVNAKLFHDFHNHIGVLRRLLAHEKYGEAAQYLDELQAPVHEMTDAVWTGDETLDYLINSKASMAAENGIQMHTEIEFPRNTNIRSVDLCAIVGNLLDNALEAAGQVPEPERRYIRLIVRRINQMLVIKVENSFFTEPVQEGGELQTTKKDGGLHGWGIRSVRTAAEKYDGMVQSDHSGNTFCVVVTLCFG